MAGNVLRPVDILPWSYPSCELLGAVLLCVWDVPTATSRHFFNSEYIQKVELPVIREAAARGQLTLIVVHVSASTYRNTWLSEIQAANDPKEPLDTLEEGRADQALVGICEKIIEAQIPPVRVEACELGPSF